MVARGWLGADSSRPLPPAVPSPPRAPYFSHFVVCLGVEECAKEPWAHIFVGLSSKKNGIQKCAKSASALHIMRTSMNQ